MTDALLAPTDQEEAFSRAYVDAVSAGAGYTVSAANFDRDGIDVTISAGGDFRPRLDVQLKATIRLGEPTAGVFRYPLKQRNYDLLRVPATTPRILVVLALPEDPSLWLSVSETELILRRCAYWSSLANAPETDNRESVTISVLEQNRFDVPALRALMDRARAGSIA